MIQLFTIEHQEICKDRGGRLLELYCQFMIWIEQFENCKDDWNAKKH